MAERQGVEIDYCPSCRGIWLDRGELDKILDRAAGLPGGASAAPAAAPVPDRGFASAPVPGYDGYRDGGSREGGYREPGYRDGGGYRDDRRPDDRRYDERRDPRDPRYPYGKKKKRESWLGDLLDFG
jgi:Zn-finger nucleic acid-binding protein